MRFVTTLALMCSCACAARAQDSTLRVLVLPQRLRVHCITAPDSSRTPKDWTQRTVRLGTMLEWREIDVRYSRTTPEFDLQEHSYHPDSLGGRLESVTFRFASRTTAGGVRVTYQEKPGAAAPAHARVDPLSRAEIERAKRLAALVRRSACDTISDRTSSLSGAMR